MKANRFLVWRKQNATIFHNIVKPELFALYERITLVQFWPGGANVGRIPSTILLPYKKPLWI